MPTPTLEAIRAPALLALALWLGLSSLSLAPLQGQIVSEVSAAKRRLPRDQLLVYQRADGAVSSAQTAEEWLARRAAIAESFLEIAGQLPEEQKRCPLELRIEAEVDCGKFVRRLISYQSEPGCRTPAYLCIPKPLLAPSAAAEPAPAVLCLHSTNDRVGHGLVVGLGDEPNLAYANELAERGFVAVAPSYPLLANYQPDLKGLGWESGTLKAVWDNQRALDLLASLPYVRPGPVVAIGHSLGGHNAVFTAFLDPRVGVVVSSCGLDSFLDYYDGNERVWLPEKGWTQTRYMPRLREYRGRLEQIPFDFPELIAGLAPRPVLLIAPQRDENFRAASVDRIVAAARPVFELYGAGEHLSVLHPDCGHDFPRDMREAAYDWIAAALQSR